jgi:hypothetical protein
MHEGLENASQKEQKTVAYFEKVTKDVYHEWRKL